MNSRISDDISDLFICFCEVAQPETPDKDGWVIQKFPDSYNEQGILATIPKFVYPCEFENATVLHFSFVFTNAESKWTFGFCRHDPKTATALVFLSWLPWHEVFVRILNTVADLIRACEVKDLTDFLEYLKKTELPEPGSKFSVRLNEKLGSFNCTIPTPYLLPTIPVSRNLTEYYSAVETNNMIVIFASMLQERRIVIKSRKLHRLSACVQAANTVIYPMNWQHIFIPLLPRHLTEYLFAPMPFLIGIPSSTWDNVKKSDIGEIVLLDADTNVLETPFHDAEAMPVDVVKFLKSQLKNQSAMLEDGFARTFLKALVQLIGGYRDALRFQQGEKITFNPEAFVESRPQNMQPFLRDMLQLQIFQQFVEERLDMLNAGLGFSDEFEFEAYNYTAKVSNSAINDQYNNWVSAMKKQGTAFFKTVKNKTNPAMRSAVRTVKEKGKDVKSAYKGIRTRMRKEGHGSDRAEPSNSNSTFHRARPLTVGSPVVAASTFKKQRATSNVATSRSNEYVPLNSPTEELASPPAHEEEVPAPRIDMDLLGDLQDVLNRQCSLMESSPPVDRTLKPVRSLDGNPMPGREWPDSWEGAVPSVLQPARAPRSAHPPLSRPTWSLPLSPSPNLAPTNPFAFTFPTPSPLLVDPFGFSADASGTTNLSSQVTPNNPFFQPAPEANPMFLPYKTSTTAKAEPLPRQPATTGNLDPTFRSSQSTKTDIRPPHQLTTVENSDPFPRNQPNTTSHRPGNSKCNGTADLIRLDSTSSQNDNSMSRENSDDSIKFKTGLMNPLYPYYTLSTSESGSTSKKPTNGVVEPPLSQFPNNTSFVHNSQSSRTSCFNEQDMNLLKEYGIDFKSKPSPAAKTTSNNNIRSEPLDPFDLPFETSVRTNTPSTWATFD